MRFEIRRLSIPKNCVAVAAAIISMLALGAGHVAAQEDPGGPTATFYEPLQVQLVDVDVVVTDRSGVPITDLTPNDFEVFEDGEPMDVTHFFAARGAEGVSGDSRLADDIFLVMYFDDTNVDPQLRTSVLNHLHDFLGGEVPENVSTMLVRFDGSLHVESDFSAGTADVLATLDRFAGTSSLDPNREGEALLRRMQGFRTSLRLGPGNPRGVITQGSDSPVALTDPMELDPEEYAFIADIHQYARRNYEEYRTSLDALQRFAGVLGALPGRTIMLWVGGIESRPGEALFRTWQDLFPVAARRRGVDATAEALRYDLTREVQGMLEKFNRDRISLFPVGLTTGGGRGSSNLNTRILETAGRPGTQGHTDERAEETTMAMMAAVTGGRRLTDNAKLDEQLAEVAEELASFYSLGYRPPSPGDGKYHRIAVKVRREGAVARYREGYLASGSGPGVSERTVAAAILGTGTNPLGITVACREQEPRESGSFLVPVAVSVPLGELVLTPESGRHSARISVLSVVRDKHGGLSEVNERQYPIEIKNEELLSAVEQQATFVLGMVLRGGDYRIAVSVRDDRSSVESTVFVDVAVGAASGSSTG